MCYYTECQYAEYHIFIVVLRFIMAWVRMLSVIIQGAIMLCQYAECRIFMLSVVMLLVFMLCVIKLGAIMLSIAFLWLC